MCHSTQFKFLHLHLGIMRKAHKLPALVDEENLPKSPWERPHSGWECHYGCADSECIEMESMRLGLSLEAILPLFSVVQNGDEEQKQKAD